MPAFTYRAADANGKIVKGLLDAVNEAAVRSELRKRKLLPLSVEASRGRDDTGSINTHKLSLKKQVLVTRQMSTLVGSHVRIEEAIKIVADQLGNARDTALLLDLRSAVVDGVSFADALEKIPSGFDEYFRASIRAGESSGKLAQVLDHLASHIEERARNRQVLQLALIYPCLLALVSIGVVVALLTFVVPDIVRVFTARGSELPALTRMLISTSEWVQQWGLMFLGCIASLSFTFVWILRFPEIRMRWDRSLTNAPFLSRIVLQSNASQFSGTLATLVQSGVPLVEALKSASGTVKNTYIKDRLTEVTRQVEDGASLSRSAQEARVFPPMFIAMIASGEASSTLGSSLESASKSQSASLKATVTTIVSLVEPFVLLIMGGIVMVLVMAILMPIVGLNSIAG